MSLKSKIEECIKSVKIPKTNKSLYEDERVVSLEADNNEMQLTYNRNGLSAQDKKDFEKILLGELSYFYSQDNINIKTVSDQSGPKEIQSSAQSSEQNSQAQLNVGHGQNMNKRKVEGAKKIIAVASGKGGVGKSTFSVNFALSLKNKGFKVGLVDADIYGPSLPTMMGKKDAKPKANENKKILPIEAHGIGFISFGLFIPENDPVVWRGPMLGGVLNQFLFDVVWDDVDYLIIDLPPGTGDMQLSLAQNAQVDGAIIITTPQDVALLDAKKGLNMFKKVNVPVLGMVENMSTFICSRCGEEHDIFGKGTVEAQAKILETNFLGKIPLSMELRLSSDEGTPFMANSENKETETAKSYEQIVDNFLNTSKTNGKKGFFSKMLKL